jgi:hypothetical protein
LITAWHRSNEASKRLDDIPGVGPALATALSRQRERFLANFSFDRLRPSLLAKICHQKKQPCQTLLARIEKLVDQVRFNSGVPSQQVRHEHLGKRWLFMEHAHHRRFVEPSLLFPIDWPEPFGLVMIEAMACGTPVLAFRHGSVSEIVDQGVTGAIVEINFGRRLRLSGAIAARDRKGSPRRSPRAGSGRKFPKRLTASTRWHRPARRCLIRLTIQRKQSTTDVTGYLVRSD